MIEKYQVACLLAQEKEEGASAAQANNPLANITALNIQNYCIPKLTIVKGNILPFWLEAYHKIPRK
jgi:hypothetical protein